MSDAKQRAQKAILERLGQSGALIRRQRLKAHLAPKEPEKKAEKQPAEEAVDLSEVYADPN